MIVSNAETSRSLLDYTLEFLRIDYSTSSTAVHVLIDLAEIPPPGAKSTKFSTNNYKFRFMIVLNLVLL